MGGVNKLFKKDVYVCGSFSSSSMHVHLASHRRLLVSMVSYGMVDIVVM